MARYFVTGTTDLVGGAVARQLVAHGDQVVALARAPERAAHSVAGCRDRGWRLTIEHELRELKGTASAAPG